MWFRKAGVLGVDLRKTWQACLNEECLEFINALGPDEENKENLEWHVALLLGQIRGLYEIQAYHVSYPWRVVLALDPQKWPELLLDMAQTWSFVRHVVDPLPVSDRLCQHLLFTRYQAFRDLMVKAEQFGSDLGMNVVLSLVVFCSNSD